MRFAAVSRSPSVEVRGNDLSSDEELSRHWVEGQRELAFEPDTV